MNTYIALLRGINVGGHRKIKMADLRALLKELKLVNVTTYIQSGNVVFNSEFTRTACEDIIKKAIKKRFNFNVPVLVLDVYKLKEICNSCPFSSDKQEESYYTILATLPARDKVGIFKSISFPDEEIMLIDTCVYFYTRKGMGKAKYSNNLAETKLKVEATTRNHRTLSKLLELAKSI